jgi:hypothetical protein
MLNKKSINIIFLLWLHLQHESLEKFCNQHKTFEDQFVLLNDHPRERFVFRNREDTPISLKQVYSSPFSSNELQTHTLTKEAKEAKEAREANDDLAMETEWDLLVEELKEMVWIKYFDFKLFDFFYVFFKLFGLLSKINNLCFLFIMRGF